MPSRRDKPKSSLAVGSRVKFVFGIDEVTATVVEDRGNVGIGGRRLLRVRLDIPDTSEPIELEIPADDVKAAA
jgi:hypothetical protein